MRNYGHNIATVNISPMNNENKQHPEAKDHYYDTEAKEEEIRRPSIPSIVPLKNHGHHPSDDGDIVNNTSAPIDDGDDLSRCSFSSGSLISELTLMTFSEEKAAMLKSEFLSRVQQDSHTRQLSKEEKMALLIEIQAEQDRKFKMEMQRQEKKRSMKREGERTRHEFFERLNALRVGMGRDGEHHHHQQMEGSNHNISERDSPPDHQAGAGCGQDGGVMSDSGAEHEEKQKGQQPPCRRAYMTRRRSSVNRRRSFLSNSDTTEKRSNSNRSLLPPNAYGHKDEHMVAAAEVAAASMASPNSDSESKSSKSTIETNTTSRAHIEALIELKMEIANQQATIDTITAQLHNLEIVNSRLLSSLSREESARKAADKSNEELTEQLKQCREREVKLRREIMASAVTRPAMMKQSSTVDWGNADDKDGSDDNDKDRSILLDKLKKLEQENEDLTKENERLRHGMRQSSINTECTEPSTSLDSSEEHKSSQPQPRHQARPEESLSASLRSLGSSMKLPFTKMRRSRSDMGQYNTNCFDFEEELLKDRSPSTGTLDDIKDNFRGFASASSGAEETDNSSPRGIILQAHMKAERRWSIENGGQQKTTVESRRTRTERRGWGSWREGDSDESRGIGGLLNGWRVFGKVDEVDDEGASTGMMI